MFSAKIDHPSLQAMYRYWLSRRNGRLMPARRDIVPQDIPDLLPHIMLIDVLPEGRYRFRLVGTHFGEHVGGAITGRYLEDMATGEHFLRSKRNFDTVAQLPGIHYLASELFWRARSWTMYRRLLMPLSDDGQTVNMLIGAAFYEPRDDQSGAIRRMDEAVTVRDVENETMPLPVG